MKALAGSMVALAPPEHGIENGPEETAVVDLRCFMRAAPLPVAVVTVSAGETPHGMTLTAFGSVTLEPPTVGLYVNRSASIQPHLRPDAILGVNLLSLDQIATAGDFSNRQLTQSDRFERTPWRQHPVGAPVLTECLAVVFCRITGLFEFGTHTSVVAAVERCEGGASGEALLYGNGSYGRFLPFEQDRSRHG